MPNISASNRRLTRRRAMSNSVTAMVSVSSTYAKNTGVRYQGVGGSATPPGVPATIVSVALTNRRFPSGVVMIADAASFCRVTGANAASAVVIR